VQVVRECSRAKLASLLHVWTFNPDSNLTGFSTCKWATVTQNVNVLLLSKIVYRLFIAIVCCEIIAVVGSIMDMKQQDKQEQPQVLHFIRMCAGCNIMCFTFALYSVVGTHEDNTCKTVQERASCVQELAKYNLQVKNLGQ